MSKPYLTKLHNELTNKKIQHEFIQEDYLTCVKIPVNKNAQPFVIEEYHDADFECQILVTQTQTKLSQFEIYTEEDFNEYVRFLEVFVG